MNVSPEAARSYFGGSLRPDPNGQTERSPLVVGLIGLGAYVVGITAALILV
jgi:hypothetical protein